MNFEGEIEREKERQRIETVKRSWGDRTEEWLCDAALRGDVGSLKEIIAKDEYILDKILVGGFKGKNPLHVAMSTGQREFVVQLLTTKPELAEVLDTKVGTALHIASSKGHLEIVEPFSHR
ncbi:hypothetical protein Vadar_001513 [Vaccinium darrowii]|uniref:Uncharacterized protein n=1 Tax=Vaccinium darrowii TaxID=229202 RepID=A0ACB7Z1U5_9ERIC|nr:hypothetical protein Vadar_001513 [Vaccinium darrowii]